MRCAKSSAMFEVPVIFVTSFPERLLTGERPEPTFLITKPYDPNAVKAAISQALFFRTAALGRGLKTRARREAGLLPAAQFLASQSSISRLASSFDLP